MKAPLRLPHSKMSTEESTMTPACTKLKELCNVWWAFHCEESSHHCLLSDPIRHEYLRQERSIDIGTNCLPVTTSKSYQSRLSTESKRKCSPYVCCVFRNRAELKCERCNCMFKARNLTERWQRKEMMASYVLDNCIDRNLDVAEDVTAGIAK